LRELTTFAAYFSLNDEGDLETILWDDATIGVNDAYPRRHRDSTRTSQLSQPGWHESLESVERKSAAIIMEDVWLERGARWAAPLEGIYENRMSSRESSTEKGSSRSFSPVILPTVGLSAKGLLQNAVWHGPRAVVAGVGTNRRFRYLYCS